MQSVSGYISIDGTWSVVGDTLRQVPGGVDMNVLLSSDAKNMVFYTINGSQTFLPEKR